jgi:uncharacterized membrane protein
MKQQRLDGLADGIFSIVMTLLAIELHVPQFPGRVTNGQLWEGLTHIAPVLLSFILSFSLVFTYWRAHHYIVSVYARTLTVGLASINALFFLFVTLVPFSARLIGEYSYSHVAITIYGINIILIGLSLYIMRRLVELDPAIDTVAITKADRRSGYIRILFPVFCAILAIGISFVNTTVSLVLFAGAIIFNLVPASTNIIHEALDKLFADDNDIIESNHKTMLKDDLIE